MKVQIPTPVNFVNSVSALILLCMSSLSVAQTATYQGGVVTIPQLGVTEGDQPSFHTEVKLQLNTDGGFSLMSAEEASLVMVDSAEAVIMESLPVQVSVNVAGNKSVPCVSLLEPAVTRNESTFTIVLAESRLGPAETCIAVLDPFEKSIALDVAGLSAGEYSVKVNGVETSFTLATDN